MSDRTKSHVGCSRTLGLRSLADFVLYDAPSGERAVHRADGQDVEPARAELGGIGGLHAPVGRGVGLQGLEP